ncbi:putative MFS family arabinose efflux permease [Tumebacillus sp. BK434]|uniref:MFS transporter n=1 Tax=Tumebacillus sp. BK434 TaxID=2512169 RepID=UPI0010433927|nr:MFS transporter [Tumebacillus sp. BK434]TCP56060.1 putative MFS family arabinose efflux permease [Tumebacillus sp. BK434]
MLRLVAILVSIGLVGMTQGLIVPLLSFILEQREVSAVFNGISTTALFLGVIVASPFIELVVRKYGAKRTILYSTGLAFIMTLAFPIWDNLYAWIAFRVILGIALSGIFVSTEIWLNTILTANNRGRMFAFYGLAIAIGLMIGPLGINLLSISLWAPFLVSALCYIIPMLITIRIPDDDSRLGEAETEDGNGIKRWWRIFWLAPFAMLASLVYGYMDGALIGQFPIYGSRLEMAPATISLTLSVFVFGSIVFQFPLGWLSDIWGRRQTLLLASCIGLAGFLLLPLAQTNTWMLMTMFFLVGGALGSFYSLGLAYLGDLLYGSDLPTGNVLYTMLYGVGSIMGPSFTGAAIQYFGKEWFAWSIAAMLLIYAAYGLLHSQTIKNKGSAFTTSGN